MDVVTLAGSSEPWGDLATETDQFDFISIADGFVPFLHSFMMIPTLRDFFSSEFFLKLAGPKHTDQKGMGRFLGKYLLRPPLNGANWDCSIVKDIVSKRFDESVSEKHTQGDMLVGQTSTVLMHSL